VLPPPAKQSDNCHMFVTPLITIDSGWYTSPSVDWSLCRYHARPSSHPSLWRCQGEHIDKRRKYSLEVDNKHLYEKKFLEIVI